MKTRERSAAGGGNGRQAVPGVGMPLGGERLPSAPRERKPALAALAVLLILVGALGATVMVMRAGDKISVVEITQPVAEGTPVPSTAVREIMVSDVTDDTTKLKFIRWSLRDDLFKNYQARTNLVPGSVLTLSMVVKKEDALPAGKSLIGLTLKDGQYPYSLAPGDTVAAYQVGDDATKTQDNGSGGNDAAAGGPTLISGHVTVRDKSKSSNGLSSDDASFIVLVDTTDAPALAAAAHAGEVVLALVSPSSS